MEIQSAACRQEIQGVFEGAFRAVMPCSTTSVVEVVFAPAVERQPPSASSTGQKAPYISTSKVIYHQSKGVLFAGQAEVVRSGGASMRSRPHAEVLRAAETPKVGNLTVRLLEVRSHQLGTAEGTWLRCCLSGVNLSGANLHGADLESARCTIQTLWPDGFMPASAGLIMQHPNDPTAR